MSFVNLPQQLLLLTATSLRLSVTSLASCSATTTCSAIRAKLKIWPNKCQYKDIYICNILWTSQLGFLLHDLFIINNIILNLGLALGLPLTLKKPPPTYFPGLFLALGWMVSNLLLLWLLHGDVQLLHGFPSFLLTPSLVIAGLSLPQAPPPSLVLGSRWLLWLGRFFFLSGWGRSITTAVLAWGLKSWVCLVITPEHDCR